MSVQATQLGVLVLCVCVAVTHTAPAQQARDESLPQILGRLHNVLGSLQQYLDVEAVKKSGATAAEPGVDQRNEEGPIPELSEVDELVDIAQRSPDTARAQSAESGESNEVSLREVLRYLIDLQREHETHKSHQTRDHGV